MRYTFTLLFCAVSFFTLGQRAIVIDALPANTPDGATLHLGASANGWNPGDPTWVFNPWNGDFLLEVPEAAPNSFQGKVTMGDWSGVEGTAGGGFVPNRTFNFSNSDTLTIQVAGWEGMPGGVDDLPPNVVVLDDSFFMPELDRSRRIRLFLPSDYDASTADYPVLYMHDGQNLFSAQEAFAGEWEVDESMLAFEAGGYSGAIVVAIDNGGSHRIDEYTPWANDQYGGGEGEAYTDFIVNTLKPFVDENYRTLSDRDHTGIMGSSLGGLISFYGGVRHQDVFSKVGVFSPSFWFTDDIYTYTETAGKNEDMRIFFLAGEQESGTLVPNIDNMINILSSAGFGPDEVRFDTHDDGQHSEWFWAREFPVAFVWLYMNTSVATSSEDDQKRVLIYPNPSQDTVNFDWPENVAPKALYIFDTSGRSLIKIENPPAQVDVSGLSRGLYLVKFDYITHFSQQCFIKE